MSVVGIYKTRLPMSFLSRTAEAGEVQALRAWAATGEIDLCYGDQMGVSRQAVVPYGWQAVGKVRLVYLLHRVGT